MDNIIIRHPHNDDINKMRILWKKTFNDSEKYLDIIFKNYQRNKFCQIAELKGSIISSLIGIPYLFNINNSYMEGLYLCGLSTESIHRGKGIMGKMLLKVPNICKDNNLSFSFLIPADLHLRSYYKKYNFVNSHTKNIMFLTGNISIISKIITLLKTNIHICNMINSGYNIITNISDICNENINFRNIIEICLESEMNREDYRVLHSRHDWELIILDKILSGNILIESRYNKTIFFLSFEGCLEIINGDVNSCISCLLEILSIARQFLNYDSQKLIATSKGFGLTDYSMDLSLRREDFGMICFYDDIFILKSEKSKGSENRIFENSRGIHEKYQKIKFHEFWPNSKLSLAEKIKFNFMLD